MINSRKTNQHGDTIVEVLIAIVIVSSVLVAAFSISNLSLKQIRMSQERGEAQKIAQQATENLDRIVETTPSILTENPALAFCKNPASYARITLPSSLCTIAPRYNIEIQRQGTPPTSKTFRIRVWWDGLKGTREELIYYYNIPGL